MSEIQTVWKRDATELSEIQTSSDFCHSLYSVVPKTGRPVWQTGHKSVRISNFRFSDVRERSKTSGFRMPELIRAFEIRTILSGFQTLHLNRTSEIRTILSGFQTLYSQRPKSEPD